MKNKAHPQYNPVQYESLNQMVCHKAETCGNKIAFQYMRGKTVHSITFKEFLDDVLITGKYISTICENPTHVAIVGENSYQWLVGFMAAIMSGNVAVLLDKELDVADIEELLHQSDSQICIYSSTYGDLAEELAPTTSICFLQMDDLAQLQRESDADYELLTKWNHKLDKNAVAAMFFTSGTSGKSKAVLLSQENMASNIYYSCQRFYWSGNVLAVLPFHHAFGSVISVFTGFFNGYTVFINSSLKNVKRDMLVAKPQMMVLVPLFIETFHKTIWQTAKKQGAEKKLRIGMFISNVLLSVGIDIRRKLFHSVLEGFGGNFEFVISGGAALHPKYIKEFRALGIEIVHGYGITECAPVVAGNGDSFHKDGSIGIALEGCSIRIKTDSEDTPIGEIQVRGKNVMLGYYNDEEATRLAFDEGWFRTGDLGYIDPEGFLFITGRKKNLIILSNGENVSPEELEQLLGDYDIVKEVLVYEEDGMITAEIYPDSDRDIEETTKLLQGVVDTCNRRLPTYKKIQKLKVRKTEFEKTTTQKIKR